MTDLFENLQITFFDELVETLKSPAAYFNRVTKTVIVVAIFTLLGLFLLKKIKQSKKNVMDKRRLEKRVKVSIQVLLVISLLIIWVNALNALVLLMIALGLFLMLLVKGLLDNLIAWFLISKRHYFKRDQRIEINEKIGKVVSIGLFHFELAEIKNWLSSEQLTGRSIKIPNKEIFDYELFNYSSMDQLIWKEVSYTICHDNDWQAAKAIMLSAVENYYAEILLPKMDQEMYEHLEVDINPKFNLSVEEKGLVLWCQFMVDYKEVASTQTRLHEEILTKFNEHPQIEFAVFDVKLVN